MRPKSSTDSFQSSRSRLEASVEVTPAPAAGVSSTVRLAGALGESHQRRVSSSASAAPQAGKLARLKDAAVESAKNNFVVNAYPAQLLLGGAQMVANSGPVVVAGKLARSTATKLTTPMPHQEAAAVRASLQAPQEALMLLKELQILCNYPQAVVRDVDNAKHKALTALQNLDIDIHAADAVAQLEQMGHAAAKAHTQQARAHLDVVRATLQNMLLYGAARTGTTFGGRALGRAGAQVFVDWMRGKPLEWGFATTHSHEPPGEHTMTEAAYKLLFGAIGGGVAYLAGKNLTEPAVLSMSVQQSRVAPEFVLTDAKRADMNDFLSGWGDAKHNQVVAQQKERNKGNSETNIRIREFSFGLLKTTQMVAQHLTDHRYMGFLGNLCVNAGVSALSGLLVGGLQSANKAFASIDIPTDAALADAKTRQAQGEKVEVQNIATEPVSLMYTQHKPRQTMCSVVGTALKESPLLDPAPSHGQPAHWPTMQAASRALSTSLNVLTAGVVSTAFMGRASAGLLIADLAADAVAALNPTVKHTASVLIAASVMAIHFELRSWANAADRLPRIFEALHQRRQAAVDKNNPYEEAAAASVSPSSGQDLENGADLRLSEHFNDIDSASSNADEDPYPRIVRQRGSGLDVHAAGSPSTGLFQTPNPSLDGPPPPAAPS
jgi:hypothetical protein